MAKPFQLTDFRARRIVMEGDNFLLDGRDLAEPTDLIDEETWHSIVDLSDDVALWTTNQYGSLLHDIWSVWGEFICMSIRLQELNPVGSPIDFTISGSLEDFQASVFNAVTGYYRLSFSALRNVLENITLGLNWNLNGPSAEFSSWSAGTDVRVGLGSAADRIIADSRVKALEDHLWASTNDDLFSQENSRVTRGGFTRRLFRKLTKYTHGSPGFTDFDMRQSNGPGYRPQAFLDWAVCFLQVLAYSVLAAKLAEPRLRRQFGEGSEYTACRLFKEAVRMLRRGDDGNKLFRNLPSGFWK